MLSECAKQRADFALIAQSHQVMKGLKITHVIWSKSADKHFSRELHTQGFELVTWASIQVLLYESGAVTNHSGITLEHG